MKRNRIKEEIRNQIRSWNQRFPIDYWWRKKYNIPYGSDEHRKSDLIQMFYDYEEEKMMNDLIARMSKSDSDEFDEEIKNEGVKMSKEDIDNAFDNIDLSKY